MIAAPRPIASLRLLAGVAVAVVLGGGCAAYTSTRVIRQSHDVRVTRSNDPGTVRVVKRLQSARVGRSVELLHAQRVQGHRLQIDLILTAGSPSVSHTALSSYAYAPAHGSYVTFEITIRNHGEVPVLIRPTDFFVDVGGDETHVTSYDGNAAYSGAHQQLDATQLSPGQSVRKPLTYDVSSLHGTLVYAPGRRPAIRWRF